MKQLRDSEAIRQAQSMGYPVGTAGGRLDAGDCPTMPVWLWTEGGTTMGRHFVSYEAQCPFYKAEDKNIIYCEGVRDNSSIHNAFPGSAAAYKKEYCCAGWENCLIAKALWSKYD
ncbi:MAG: hypothetical protein IJB09_04575 [Oscillospiraceae bacterium]|nr:hypothetical protein [Oscillospiraceae bacterium]